MDSSTPTSDTWNPNGNGSGNGNGAGLMDKAREQVQPLVHQAQEKAGEVMGQAREQVTTQLSTQKDRATEGLGGVAQALRQAGRSLSEQDSGAFGQYAETAADQVERIAQYLEEKDMDQLLTDVQEFARSRPALILGATFALGFLAARLLKNAETGPSGGQFRSDTAPTEYATAEYTPSDAPDSGYHSFSDPAYSGLNR